MSGLALSFKYNSDGLRTHKTVTGTTTTDTQYTWDGNRLIAQHRKNPDGTTTKTFFLYDIDGEIGGMIHAGSKYYYVKNLQGDVVRILNSAGQTVCDYVYDSWGKIVRVTNQSGADITGVKSGIAYVNPIRYRGYYYDVESGLYYLQSRYYNPEWGRFVNADSVLDGNVGSSTHNLYTYCGNNPVNAVDPTGHYSEYDREQILRFGSQEQKDALKAYDEARKTIVISTSTHTIHIVQPGQPYDHITEANALVAIDYRNRDNPNMQIRNSYLITDPDIQREIAAALLAYSNANPTGPEYPPWNRTVESMVTEWDFHNGWVWLFGERMKHTDFDNAEEGWSDWDYLWNRGGDIFK